LGNNANIEEKEKLKFEKEYIKKKFLIYFFAKKRLWSFALF
jgi:hypothetical protein